MDPPAMLRMSHTVFSRMRQGCPVSWGDRWTQNECACAERMCPCRIAVLYSALSRPHLPTTRLTQFRAVWPGGMCRDVAASRDTLGTDGALQPPSAEQTPCLHAVSLPLARCPPRTPTLLLRTGPQTN
ncbi:hypothetical protein B0H10DRAFT_2026136 [Mycena sp. CBHHK59/15]|nr:hypothetical protein B0H10DRAFT_2026136 [Mycena sp. CBHHK59/15]